MQERAVAPGGPQLTAMAFWDGQAGAFKDAGRAGGGRHACPRRGRAACGVGRSGRIEGEVGRRGVLWQEKSWARREVRSPPRSSPELVGIDINIDGTRCHRVIYVLEQARFIVSCEGKNLPILITS